MKNTSRRNAFFLVAVLSTLIAIGLHLYLNKHHIDLKLGMGSTSTMCNISEKLNCDVAASSKYSEIFGIPMALLGAIANGFLLLLLGLYRMNWTEDSERTGRYAFYLSVFIFSVSLIMGTISLLVLQSGCPFCMGTYAASLVTVLALWFALPSAKGYFADDFRDLFTTQKWVLGTALGLAVFAFIVNNMILDSYGYQQIKQVRDSSLTEWKASPVQEFDPQAGLVFQKGTAPAKVVVVEFADFLCGHCKTAYPALHTFVKNHEDVKLVYKPFPLDGACNAAIPSKGDGKTCELAYAALCGEKIAKKGFDVHHYIFDNQESIFSTPMNQVTENICKATGVDCTELKTCMSSDEIHQMVKNTAAEGAKAKITGTPSVFLNNKLLPGGQLLPVLENVYKSGAF